ncbi:hypothetical protein CPC735_043480 [Coccidioides posadasii C735 delta SOWgp]|uniref:Large ribosomal subunit protein bL21m n=1 Tax=Coccidioides posadasii (strain C735) TaxID=222929 RepID=C5PBC0_COCP7|nr:hypothetical protein CPC735_043480 [Coccidioides posadasii C735 delta SOWgp]EER25904.1 hypothetical protein CPC735_043480 [Coccidioides posadasii C735 delta SOWgp]|eukprot:XP_003068049.1 hypothetical protein CPC735_043480 [Coccidioides posadasii C735 delta SOWgp]
MLSRLPVRAALDLRARSTALPSSTFAARRVYLHQVSPITQFRETHPEIPPQSAPAEQPVRQSKSQTLTTASQTPPSPTTPDLPSVIETTIPAPKPAVPPTFTEPVTLTESIISLLPRLTTQSPHYITAHIHARPYILTAGDTLRLPFLMPDVHSGDIIRLNRASTLGSRDFTLKGAPYIDERLFECRLRVMGVESEPLRVKEKTKRRQRHIRRVKSKHKYTILRVMDVKVKTLEELIAEGAQVEK